MQTRKRKATTAAEPTLKTTVAPTTPPKAKPKTAATPKKAKAKPEIIDLEGLYRVPRKVASKTPRIALMRNVPLGYAKAKTFEQNIASMFASTQEIEGGRPAWDPASIHFKLNRLYGPKGPKGHGGWQECSGRDFAEGEGCAFVDRMKAWVEQQWPEAFVDHKDK